VLGFVDVIVVNALDEVVLILFKLPDYVFKLHKIPVALQKGQKVYIRYDDEYRITDDDGRVLFVDLAVKE
jgi:hypothetical protein